MLFRSKKTRLFKFTLSVMAVSLFTFSQVSQAKNKKSTSELSFESYQISAPFKVSQPIIPINLFDEITGVITDELILIGEDEQRQAWLAVYAFNQEKNDFILVEKMKVENKYFAYDVGENSEKLFLLSKDEIVTLHYRASKLIDATPVLSLQPYQAVKSLYLIDTSNYIAHKDFIQDVNADGLDDIVLPHFNQLNLWLSAEKEQAVVMQSLRVNTITDMGERSISFTPKTFFLVDMNIDDLQDIAWVEQGFIYYFPQLLTGQFSLQSEVIKLDDKIYGLNWWQINEADGDSLDQSQLSHRMVEEIRDVNGDGLADMIVRYTQSSGVLDRTNDYEFYYGQLHSSNTSTGNSHKQLTFNKSPTTTIKADGTLTGLTLVDVNNDEKLEVLLSSFELSLGNIIGALLSGGIDQNVLVFSQDENNVFEEDANVSEEVELSFSLSKGRSGAPIVRLIDVNGDSLQDLVLSDNETRLKVYLGNKSTDLFERKGIKHELALPKNGDLFSHHDINNDGKEDFLMHYGRLDGEEMANKVTILLVK